MQLKLRNARFFLASLLPIIVLLLTACWSSKEIEELGLIAGTSLDLDTEISVTNQFITSETTGAGTRAGNTQGGNTQKAYKNVTETGKEVLPAMRNMLLKIDKRAFAEHSKVIVVGEEFARSFNLQQALDFFLREVEMRPSAILLIAKNHASDILETNEPTKIPAFQLVEMLKGHNRTTKILPPMTLAKLEGKLQSNASFLVQNVVSEDGEVKFDGAAIIEGKTKKLHGFLNEKDIEGITLITGKGEGGLIKSLDKETNQPIIYEIFSVKSKIIPHVKGDNISFDVIIESEGRIAEHWVLSEKTFDNKFLRKAEKFTEQEVEHLVENVLEKIQQEYKTDVAGFGNRLRIEYPKIWGNVKKDWDEIFSQVPINCKVKIRIKDYGTSGD